MSRTVRGKRDSTGPYQGSFQRKDARIGKRQQAGETCPVSRKKGKRRPKNPYTDW
ncbi:hypothetical protein KAX35_02170 [candidate division WOR-3 bacterium]|nr:hypothetical protein [candidate division WOR-3 bacterium]